VTRPVSPAYAYGRVLGAYRAALEAFAEDVVAGFRSAQIGARPPLTLEQREILREIAYRERIARELQVGRAYVRRLTDQLRRDVGL